MASERCLRCSGMGRGVGQGREARASSSNGPHRSHNSNSNSSSPEQQRTMSVEELLEGIQERLDGIELWVGNLIDDGVVFVAGPNGREHTRAQLDLEGRYVEGDFILRLSAIPRVARAPAGSRPSGPDSSARQPRGRVGEGGVANIGERHGAFYETRAPRGYVPDDSERSAQWE
ncbi:hypothetical protein FQN54_004946 [Arachnomyces sp. PD_36]|nr:hypothetical protein FQN54_004946 [Arachnomyces sp. PD_36]